MVDHVYAFQHGLEQVWIAHVAMNQIHICRKIRGPFATGVHLRMQIIQHTHSVALAKKAVGQMRSHKAGTAGDQNLPLA